MCSPSKTPNYKYCRINGINYFCLASGLLNRQVRSRDVRRRDKYFGEWPLVRTRYLTFGALTRPAALAFGGWQRSGRLVGCRRGERFGRPWRFQCFAGGGRRNGKHGRGHRHRNAQPPQAFYEPLTGARGIELIVEISATLLVGRAIAQDAVSDHQQAVRCGNNGFLRALLRFVALKEAFRKQSFFRLAPQAA
jgi:hypothetical protein